MSSEPAVLVERRSAVAWITLNRPEAINAINDEIRAALRVAIREADEDSDIAFAMRRAAKSTLPPGWIA